MHQLRERPEDRRLFLVSFFWEWLEKSMHMIGHDTESKEIVALAVEVNERVQSDRARRGGKNPVVASGKCDVINSVRPLVVRKSAFPVASAGIITRQDAGWSELEARAPQRASRSRQTRNFVFEQCDSLIERLIETFFFAMQRFSDHGLFGAQFWKDIAHRARENVNQFVKEGLVKPKRPSVANSATQDAAKDVTATFVARLDAVGDRETQRADVIGDDAKRDVDFLGSATVSVVGRGVSPRRTVRCAVGAARRAPHEPRYSERRSHISSRSAFRFRRKSGGRCRSRSLRSDGEKSVKFFVPWMIAVTRSKPMPVSTCRCGQRRERAVGVRVELDENEVPDLDAARIARVHERSLRVARPA